MNVCKSSSIAYGSCGTRRHALNLAESEKLLRKLLEGLYGEPLALILMAAGF